MKKSKKNLLKQIDWAEIRALLAELAADGWSREEALDFAAGLLDQALPCDELVAGPAGVALEAIDGPVLRAALGLLWSAVQRQAAKAA